MITGLSLSVGEIILRLAIATVVGIIFGFERARSKKPVGIRTHVLIALAACVIAMISAYGFGSFEKYYPESINLTVDPARLVVGILTGIGFIGAGIIWKSKEGVQGITTAAEIFLLAVIGIAVGMGFYLLVAITTIIAILTMCADALRRHLKKRKSEAGGKRQEEGSQMPEGQRSEKQKSEVGG